MATSSTMIHMTQDLQPGPLNPLAIPIHRLWLTEVGGVYACGGSRIEPAKSGGWHVIFPDRTECVLDGPRSLSRAIWAARSWAWSQMCGKPQHEAEAA